MTTDKYRVKKITDCMEKCCGYYFDKRFFDVSKRLLDELKYNKLLLMDDNIELWTAAIFYIVAEDSGLFDRDNENNIKEKDYMSKSDMANIFNVKLGGIKYRAKQIRDAMPDDSKFVADITILSQEVIDEYNDSLRRPILHDLINKISYMNSEEIEEIVRDLNNWESEALALYNRNDFCNKKYYNFDRKFNIDSVIEMLENITEHILEIIPAKKLKNSKYKFWEYSDARKYLIMKADLALLYKEKGDIKAASEEYLQILELNKRDHQGIRNIVIPLLIALDDDEKVEEIIKHYINDEGARMLYNKALYYYKIKDITNAKEYLEKAFDTNYNVAELFTGAKKILTTEAPKIYSPGSKEEAMVYKDEALIGWAKTEDALDWFIDRFFLYNEMNAIGLDIEKDEVKGFLEFESNKVISKYFSIK